VGARLIRSRIINLSKFLKLSLRDRKLALLAAENSNKDGLPAYIIEKDFWVTTTLKILYTELAPTLSDACEQPFIFKGGTSLSKCFNAINRMSEDIDLSFSLTLLDHVKVVKEKGVGRKKLHEKALDIDKTAGKFIRESLIEQLSTRLKELDKRMVIKIESEAPLNIGIYYPKELNDEHYGSAVSSRVLLETGGRSDNNPTVEAEISHMLGECISDLADDRFKVIALAPERTMLEKMFGVHTNLTQEKPQPKYARHLYDIIQLHAQNPEWHKNKTLFFEHVEFSDINYKTHKESCDTARSGQLKLCPSCEKMEEHYKNDWESMADMFPNAELPFTYEDLITNIREIEKAVNEEYYSQERLIGGQ
jgi:hypothetical protein